MTTATDAILKVQADAAATAGPGRTWDGKPHGAPAVAVPEPLTGEPDAEEWGEAMRAAREAHPTAAQITLSWHGEIFRALCSGKFISIPRRRPRHPRG